ncbi:hypothetical protein LINPERHAP1_LOCUS16709 [Linum perenne]
MAEKAVEAYWLMEDFDDSVWLYRLKVLCCWSQCGWMLNQVEY